VFSDKPFQAKNVAEMLQPRAGDGSLNIVQHFHFARKITSDFLLIKRHKQCTGWLKTQHID